MAETSQAFIDRSRRYLSAEYLPKIRLCLDHLTDDDVWWRANDASNSIGNLILHLAGNARQWIVSGVGRMPDARDRQAEFDQREVIPAAELLARLTGTIAEVDAVLATVPPADLQKPRRIQGCDVTVLEAIYHVVEHFAMHTGQIILLAKMRSPAGISFYDVRDGVARPRWREVGR